MSRRQALRAATAGAVVVGTAVLGSTASPDEPQALKRSTLDGDLTLVLEGRALSAIVMEKDATAAERRGARELRDHLKQMTEAGLEIAGAGNRLLPLYWPEPLI